MTTIAPEGREHHTAVWSGSRMIVWGGDDGPVFLNTGEDTILAPTAGLVRFGSLRLKYRFGATYFTRNVPRGNKGMKKTQNH